MSQYDFCILAKGRSGTHMLASALNSHPQIACEGELWKNTIKSVKEQSQVRGVIIMYNVRRQITAFEIGRVIHMVRNPEANATSFVRQQRRLNARRAGLSEETINQKFGRAFRLEASALERKAAEIAMESDRIRRWLRNRRPIVRSVEASYDELTRDGREITNISETLAAPICRFLGVDVRMLSVSTLKF